MALLQAETGNLQRVAAHFAASAAAPIVARRPLQPRMAPLMLGRRDEAADAFVRANALAPDYARADDGLGLVRQAEGRLDDARASSAR